MRAILLACVLLTMPLAGAAAPFATLAGSFPLPGGTLVGLSGWCEVPGWAGRLGSCEALPPGVEGRAWDFTIDGVLPPTGFHLCFGAPNAVECYFAPARTATSPHSLRAEYTEVMVTSSGGAQLAWTLTLH